MHVRPEILELKCPFSCRNLSIREAIATTKGFCLGITTTTTTTTTTTNNNNNNNN